jgi:hypothetical protein
MRLFQGANERSAGMVAWRRLGVLIRRFSVGLEMQNNAGPVAMIGHQALSTGFGRFEKLRWAQSQRCNQKALRLGFPGNCSYMTVAIAVSWRSKQQTTRTKDCAADTASARFEGETRSGFRVWMEKRRLSSMPGMWIVGGLLGGGLASSVDTWVQWLCKIREICVGLPAREWLAWYGNKPLGPFVRGRSGGKEREGSAK